MRMNLDPDELLTTTRSVRRRLDLERPVPREIVEECLDLALQAPNGSNQQLWQWVVVDDPAVRSALAEQYRQGMDDYIAVIARKGAGAGIDYTGPEQERIGASVYHLRQVMDRVPMLVVPLIAGRLDRADVFQQASLWGSILPAVWSLFLALRSRGLGSAWTTVHLHREREVAEILGIPFERYTQAGLFPVAYTAGTDFKRASRRPLREVLHWNRW